MEKYNNALLTSVFKSYLYMTIIATLASVLGFIINGIIIGNFIGNLGLVAFGITTPIIYGTLALAYIFSNGGSIVCSNNMNNQNRVNNNFTVTCITSLIIGIILTIILLMFPNNVASLLGASGESLKPTAEFMTGIFIGIIPIIFSMIFINYSRIDGYPKIGLNTAIIITISNLILDLILLLIFKWGIFGIGIGTSLSYYIGIIYAGKHFLSKKSSFKLTRNYNIKSELKEIIITGIPSALNQVYNMIRTFITNNLGLWVGGLIFMGALSIQSNIYLLLSGVGIGIGTTTMALGGIFYGEEDKKLLEELLKTSIKYAIMLISIITLILLIFAPFFVQIFGKNPEVYNTAIRGLRIFAISIPFSALCYIFLNFYNATKQLKLANYIGFAHSFLFLSLFAIILSHLIGGDGIWISFTIGEVLTLIGLLVIIKLITGKFPKSIKDMVLLKNEQFPQEEVIHTSINNEKSLLQLSNEIEELLKDSNLSTKTKNKIALSIEEIGKNILRFAYKKNQKKFLDIRIKYKNTEDIIIYFQDKGVPFDLIEYSKNEKDKLNLDKMGIKLIQDISKNIEYNYNINLNNTKIYIPIEN